MSMEEAHMAPFAMRSCDTRGREYAEKEDRFRSVYQRDRDRIIHSTAFRRLEYKTQVFVYAEGDYYRTRLTHTLEVAQIGRSLATALGANEVLVEAICLAHDLGHPTFGHAGEYMLNQLMADHGGFDHNRQSLRIVEKLEKRYPEFEGLNLSWEVLEGMVKHETDYDVSDASRFDPDSRGTLEAQLANPADELAYSAHDLDDGLYSGLIQPADLTGIALWERAKESVGWDGREFNTMWRHRLIRRLLGMLIDDVLTETSRRIEKAAPVSSRELQLLPENVVATTPEMERMLSELKRFLLDRLYRHPRVMRMQIKAERIITAVFQAYVAEPRQLPYWEQDKIGDRDLHRVVCDYIAGMTDRYALQEYAKLFDPLERV